MTFNIYNSYSHENIPNNLGHRIGTFSMKEYLWYGMSTGGGNQ